MKACSLGSFQKLGHKKKRFKSIPEGHLKFMFQMDIKKCDIFNAFFLKYKNDSKRLGIQVWTNRYIFFQRFLLYISIKMVKHHLSFSAECLRFQLWIVWSKNLPENLIAFLRIACQITILSVNYGWV